MADKIYKFLAKVSAKNRVMLDRVIGLLIQGKFGDLDIRKLSGHRNVFRVRKGQFRIIYRFEKGKVTILDLVHRDDNTYNKF